MKRQDTAKKTFAIRIADKSTQAEKQKNLKAIAKGHNIKINHLKTFRNYPNAQLALETVLEINHQEKQNETTKKNH